jgi:hypothetical protein
MCKFKLTLEWFERPGLGEGELEFVDVGVPDIFVKPSSSTGEVATKDGVDK